VISSSNRATAPGASIAAVRDGEPSLAQSFRRTTIRSIRLGPGGSILS
jgi:hypothetical protein